MHNRCQPGPLCRFAMDAILSMAASLAFGEEYLDRDAFLSLAFGDWMSSYTVVDRLGITTLRDPYSEKPFVQFYTRKRVGGDVVDFDGYCLMRIAA